MDWRHQFSHLSAIAQIIIGTTSGSAINRPLLTWAFFTFSGLRINKMVNWHDPALLLKDYCASRNLFVSEHRP